MKLATVNTLSEMIDTPKYTIRKWAREKIIPSYSLGRKYFFDINEVIEFIKKHKVN